LAECELVDLFFAIEKVSIALEQAFFDIVVNGQANGFNLHPEF